ncbi:MAG: hypothetical protein GY928_16465 [Colwellia sp.]|nr:hypothetical protein [Colwellia sp.]
MSALDKSKDNEARHAVFLQRFAGGLSKEFNPYLEQIKKEINSELLQADTTMYRGRKLNRILKKLEQIQEGIYSDYIEETLTQLELFAEHEIKFELASLDDVILSGSVELSAPATTQVWAAATTNPLIFPDSDDNIMLRAYMREWTEKHTQKVSKIISTGFLRGDTTQQIAQRITGKGRHIDKKVRAANKQIVRTSLAHISTVARHATMEENNDIVVGYEWVSTLDGRTSPLCRPLDGKIFHYKKNGYKPKPPLHPNCRSTTSPVLDKRYRMDDSLARRSSSGSDGGRQVNAKESYYTWLKKQSVEFQNDAIGPVRAKLLRDGGLSAKEFGALTTDQKFRPLTLIELEKKLPLAFSKAGI